MQVFLSALKSKRFFLHLEVLHLIKNNISVMSEMFLELLLQNMQNINIQFCKTC